MNHTMLIHGINAILRAAGVEAAPLTEPRADQFLIQPDQQYGCSGGDGSDRGFHGLIQQLKVLLRLVFMGFVDESGPLRKFEQFTKYIAPFGL